MSYDSQDRNKTKKVRVVVYASKPFIFVFLFELRADALALTSLYRNLHMQLQPLIKPLLLSTKYRAPKPDMSLDPASASPSKASSDTSIIYDLLFDASTLTLHSSIPNIPDPTSEFADGRQQWSRPDALNTQMQLLATYVSTHENEDAEERERTTKTSRGWWMVWMRIPEGEVGVEATGGGSGDGSENANLASGQVKIPILITEDSSETIVPTTASPQGIGSLEGSDGAASPNQNSPTPNSAGTRKAGRTGGRYNSTHTFTPTPSNPNSQVTHNTTSTQHTTSHSISRSNYSGPAHPDQERREREASAQASEETRRRGRGREIWLVRRGGAAMRDGDAFSSGGGTGMGSGMGMGTYGGGFGLAGLASRLGALATGGGFSGSSSGAGTGSQGASPPTTTAEEDSAQGQAGTSTAGAGAAEGIAGGIGVDTRRYIEGLLSGQR